MEGGVAARRGWTSPTVRRTIGGMVKVWLANDPAGPVPHADAIGYQLDGGTLHVYGPVRG